jgi:ABC-type transport system substrate-binding protein
MAGIQIADCIFDPLIRYDYQTDTLVGAAAKNWTVAQEGTVFTFELVEDARFHNGETVGAADFKHSWERLFQPDSSGERSANASYLAMIQGAEELMAGEAEELSGVKVIDELTLEVTLASSFYDFERVLVYPALAPLPSSTLEDSFFSFERTPIGNGAFKIAYEASTAEDALRLIRFEDYRGEAALLNALEFHFFADDTETSEQPTADEPLWEVAWRRTAVPVAPAARATSAVPVAPVGRATPAALRTAADDILRTYEEKTYESFLFDELDLAALPAQECETARGRFGESADGYTAQPGEQTLFGTEVCTQFLQLNFNEEPLTDVNIRTALSYAIDRQALCTELFFDSHSPAGGIIPPGVEGFREGAWPASSYNLSKAKQLLSDAGYPEGEGLAPITLVFWDTATERALFEMIEKDLVAAGFTVRREPVATTTALWDKMKSSAALSASGWILDFPLMEGFLTSLFASFGSYNQLEYHNAEVDEGIKAARAIENKKERIAAYQAVDDIIAADMPIIPLSNPHHTLICSDRTNDLSIAPDGLAAFPKAWVSW